MNSQTDLSIQSLLNHYIMYTDILISLVVVLFSSWFNFKGSVGRIEEKNTFTGKRALNLGPVSDSVLLALGQGKHKKIALRLYREDFYLILITQNKNST